MMRRRTFFRVAGQACAAACLVPEMVGAHVGDPGRPVPGLNGSQVNASDASDWETVSAQLEDASAEYGEPWDDATCRTLMKGGYLGNGDLGVHLGGTRHALIYYLGKNGFHAGNDVAGFRSGDDSAPGPYKQHILNLARLTIEADREGKALDGADAAVLVGAAESYRVRQDLKNAEIRVACHMGGVPVRSHAYLAPTRNVLVLELSTTGGRALRVRAELSVIGNAHVSLGAGADGGVIWVTKEPNAVGAPFWVKGAVAARVVDVAAVATVDPMHRGRLTFDLPASGRVVRLVVHAEHTKNAGSPLAAVQAAVRGMKAASVGRVAAENRAWWKRFWLRSHIRLEDDIQRYWYNHLYLIGSAARGGADEALGKAPGHWGPWNRADDMKWFGNMGMNYNAQNPYYGTFASNHVELVDPYIETVRHYAENTGRQRVIHRWVSPEIAARMPANCRGVEFEGSFTAHGTPSTGGGQQGAEDCCMTTNAVFAILPIVWKWKYGRDTAFLAQTAYPLMRSVADFFDDYIGKPVEGRYEVYGSVHEGADWFAKNDMFSLGAVRFLYREIIEASVHLGRDGERRVHWQDILDHLSEYPLQAWGDKITFRPDAVHDVMQALHYQGGARNTGLMFTTTFDNIGARTLPAYRWATCHTLDRGNMFHPQRWCGWQNGNDFGMMFVMAVRAGYDAHRVIAAIQGWKPEANGVVSQQDGGGIETAGIVEAINGMLLQSHDGVIRIFPNWDPGLDAEFKRLRAVGAFLVNARYGAAERRVDRVRIYSEKGQVCALQNPFEGAWLRVIRTDTGRTVTMDSVEEEVRFRTRAGVSYAIERIECPPVPAGAPRVSRAPADATVVLPATATFTVAASGRGLRYQWQKNRSDIPGATDSTYTTPSTTLWDVGSEYRCVVSNDVGMTRSAAGILRMKDGGGGGRGVEHGILGIWAYRHAGRDYTREFTKDGRCILQEGDRVGWIKGFQVTDERTVVVEGGLVHVWNGSDLLDIERTFVGRRGDRRRD